MRGERFLTRWVSAIAGTTLCLLLVPPVVLANAIAVPETGARPSDLEGAEFFLSLFGCATAIVAGGLFLLFYMARGARRDSSEGRSRDMDTR